MRVQRIGLSHFLSYREAALELDHFVALVGPNASGKSNAVAAMKLLREIPAYGLPTAIARRGGFDQLRHRSRGRPYDPAVSVEFQVAPNLPTSRYELALGALAGKRYEVKLERGDVYSEEGHFAFTHRKGKLVVRDEWADGEVQVPDLPEEFRVPPGQTAVGIGASYASFQVWQLLSSIQTVEISPVRVGELQDPSSTQWFEPDGSNVASFFEQLDTKQRRQLVDELNAIVPGIERIEPRRYSDKVTVAFLQLAAGRPREFLAKQMSDGTLRAFGILLAMLQRGDSGLIVIEEPEIAIHLGALRTLVDIMAQHAERSQVLITTHSADIVDAIPVEQLRVVWWHEGESKIGPVAEHTRDPVRKGLITPGELLRSDALDPVVV